MEFQADEEGHYECHISLKSGHDLRILVIEATVVAKERLTQIEFKTQAIKPLTQNIPVVSWKVCQQPLDCERNMCVTSVSEVHSCNIVMGCFE